MVLRKLKPCKTCGDPSFIWAHGNCKNCDGMLRAKAEQQKPIVPSKKPFKAISDKQAKRLAKYRVVRDEFLKECPVCEWEGCESRDVTLHHGAGKIGSLLWNKKYMKSLCWPHHEYCERHPAEARELEFEVSYSKDKISVYSANHQGFWYPEYLCMDRTMPEFYTLHVALNSFLTSAFGITNI